MTFHMLDITNKISTFRRSIAYGKIQVSHGSILTQVFDGSLPKGNALAAAEVTAMQAIKQTFMLLPMCHPVPIEHINIRFEQDTNKCITCYVDIKGRAKTGFEMEALLGVQIALLTLYDFLKPVDQNLKILQSQVLYKEGGKSGIVGTIPKLFVSNNVKKTLEGLSCAVVTLSDRASKGVYEDASGTWLMQAIKKEGALSVAYQLINDDADKLTKILTAYAQQGVDLVITSGGTGLSTRDITPDVIRKLSHISFAELGDYLRYMGTLNTKYSYLSRSTAGIINKTLVITFPGRLKAVQENFSYILPLMPHAFQMIHDGDHPS